MGESPVRCTEVDTGGGVMVRFVCKADLAAWALDNALAAEHVDKADEGQWWRVLADFLLHD